jgi:ABC-type dipeptide/oligopeptide/nickel transport system ATPase component
MYIKSLIYEDQSTGWKLEKIEFNNPLTLLVGVSGVGKTQILQALLNLQKISRGESLNGLKWEIEFRTSSGHDCKWSGAFENKGFVSELILRKMSYQDEKYKPLIDKEKLFIDNILIVNRNREDTLFNDVKTVKLLQQKSIIYLLKEENQIKDIYKNFEMIIFDNHAKNLFLFPVIESVLELEKYKTLESIRNSDEQIKTKLCLLYVTQKKLFEEIAGIFIDIFPNIEDIKIETIDEHKELKTPVLEDFLFIKIKEKNVSHWIEEFKISSGMLKTLIHISELYLCADNSVILIDEFENSLGINCIDELTSCILTSERNLQFIITSHHPYIINNIDYHYWKLVTRKGSVVKAEDATLYGIGRSKHEAFTQLINLDEYAEGIES